MAEKKFPGLTVDEVKARLPYPEFLAWVEYYRREIVRREKSEYYLAAIRLEMVNLQRMVKNAFSTVRTKEPAPSIDTFLLSHEETGNDTRTKKLNRTASKGVLSPEDGKAYLAASKAAWFGRLGITGNGG